MTRLAGWIAGGAPGPRLGGAAAARDAVLLGPGGDAELGWGAEQPAGAAVDMLTRLG